MLQLAVFAGLAVYAAAQSAVSAGCQTALASIASSDANKCLSLTTLYPVFTTPPGNSLVQPLNTWLVAMCGSPACDNATLAAVVTNLTTGCATDFNISSSDAASLVTTVQSLYPTVRKVLCLKHGNTLCITETLTNVETVTGPLTLDSVEKIAHSPPTSLPANITCTDCTKASYNIVAHDFPSTVSTAKPVLESQCGASFVDGSNPSDVSQSAT